MVKSKRISRKRVTKHISKNLLSHHRIFLFGFLSVCLLATFLAFRGVFPKTKVYSIDVRDSYIVVFKDTLDKPKEKTDELSKKHSFSPKYLYTKALKGFSATLSKEKLEKVKADPDVLFVTEDRLVTAFAKKPRPTKTPTPSPTPLNSPTPTKTPTPSPTPPPQPPQSIPTGVKRIGINANNKGTGIGIAILDTGIDLDHPDLAANIVADKTCVLGTPNGNDDAGHGSHVAGTVAALANDIGVVGVAPEAKLIAVKVLNSNGSGTLSGVICGVDWVTANAATYNIKVANMSLGGSGSSDNNCGYTNNDALHKAICNSTQTAGITYVVAAGNSTADPSISPEPESAKGKVKAAGGDASLTTPAAYDDTVITVSALADSDGMPGGLGPNTGYGADDTFASFSNYGNVVDLGAPGVSIFSTYKDGTYSTLHGTSMATPHVAAAAAMYLKNNPTSTWIQVRDGLKAIAEPLGSGHTDPSGLHPEPVVLTSSL